MLIPCLVSCQFLLESCGLYALANVRIPPANETRNILLKLTTSLVSQRFCAGDAEVSFLRMKLRLRYINVGDRPIILDKGSNYSSGFTVSKTIADAAGGKPELVQPDGTIVTYPDEPRFTKNQRLDSSFVVLQKGSSFDTTCEVVVAFAMDDEAAPPGTIKKGEHVLQVEVVTWWDSPELAEELAAKWKKRGYLWHQIVESEPMPFRIDKNVELENCN